MNLLKTTLTFLGLMGTFLCSAQYTLSGTIVAKETNEPIQFANIGIVNSSYGTCGFEDGTFRLNLPKHALDQEVTFSAIGFVPQKVKIDTLDMESLVIQLKENTAMLNEIKITPSDQVKTGTIGQKSPGVPGISRWGETLPSASGGSAWATKMTLPETVIDIQKIKLNIYENELDTFNLRCRIMSVGQNGMPGEDLLGRNLIFGSREKKGWVSIDFRPYQFSVAEDFFLVFEWILDKESARIAAEQEANALPWKLPHADIWNNKFMVYENEDHQLIKQKLTKSQQKQCKEREFPQTWLAIKKTNTSGTNFSRKSSMAPWIEQSSFDLVAYIEYQWY